MYKSSTPTTYRQQLREQILETSMSEFMKKGIKAVKMDDIANLLGISKRTLYEIFSNKEELLLEGIKMQDEAYIVHMKEFEQDINHNVIDIIIEFYNMQIKWLSNINMDFFFDLKKYRKVKEYFDKCDYGRQRNSQSFFKRGVEEELFREDVEYGIVLHMGSAMLEYVRHTNIYEEYGLDQVLRNVVLMFVRGISTKQGIMRLDAMLDAYSHS